MTVRNRALLLVLPTVIVLASIVIFPMIFSLSVSVLSYDLRIPEHPFIGIGNWINLLKNPDFLNSVSVTVTMILTELLFELVLGMVLALLLLQLPVLRGILQPLLLIPMMVMPVVVGYMGRLIFEVRSGPVNYFLTLLGMEGLRWHGSPDLALITILILRIWRWTPFVMATLLAGLLSLPQEPYQSAQVDGANTWQIFTKLTLPMLKPVITLVVVMRTLEVLQTFDIMYVLTLGGPGNRTTTLSLYTYLLGFRYWDIGQAAAAAWFIMIPLSILVTFFVKLMQKGGGEIEKAK